MRSNLIFALLSFVTLITACKPGDDAVSPFHNKLDCPSEVAPVTASLQGGFVLPNGFTPNGDGRNDVLRLVVSDSTAIRSMLIRVSDSTGNLLHTMSKPSDYWDGRDAGVRASPAGTYRVDYDVVLNGKGIVADSSVKGHTCIWLFGPHPTKPGYVQAPADPSLLAKIVFEDQIDPATLQHPYATGENLIP